MLSSMSETIGGDYRIKATAAGGVLRAIGAVTTASARSIQAVHRASPLAAAAMGRLTTAAALLASDFKAGESIHMEANGGGPAGRVIAEAFASGLLRGRLDHPEVDLALSPEGKLAVGQAVGTDGTLTVRRTLADGRLYTSVSPLVTGEIGDDVARYLTQSEQVPSAVALGVLVGADGRVAASGGLIVQALPGASDTLARETAERLQALGGLSRRLADGAAMEDLVASVLPAPIRWADRTPLHFGCLCSRERSLALLVSLPPAERAEMAAQGGAEVICHYCQTAYRFGSGELAGDD
jgi:molecular chaperone Hsp33